MFRFAMAMCLVFLIGSLWPVATRSEPSLEFTQGNFWITSQADGASACFQKRNQRVPQMDPLAAQMERSLKQLVEPVLPLATNQEIKAEDSAWAKVAEPMKYLNCTRFVFFDYTPSVRMVDMSFRYMPDGTISDLEVFGSDLLHIEDVEREEWRSNDIKRTLVQQFRKHPKLPPMSSLPASGLIVHYQIQVKEPASNGAKGPLARVSAVDDYLDDEDIEQITGHIVKVKSKVQPK